jgi:hypothetical protein
MNINDIKNTASSVGSAVNGVASNLNGAVNNLKGKAGSVDMFHKTDTSKQLDSLDNTFDRDWVKSTFIIKDSDIVIGDEYSKWIRKNRYYSTADNKFTCTSPGMSMGVNPKPQFTRYCDVRSKGKLTNRPDITLQTTGHTHGLGMGRYYSEAIDDNQQRIFLRFGVPKYIPLLLWIYKSFDVNKVVLQNRGVITSTLITAVGVVAKVFAIAAAPLLALGMFAANVITQSSRFYSVKDTMYVYWATVENILNQMVARRTMVPYVLQDYSMKLDTTMNRESKPSGKFVSELNELLPDVIDPETGRISIFALALRSQAAFNYMKNKDYEANKEKKLSSDFTGYKENGETVHDTYFTNNKGEASFFTEYLFKNAYDLLVKDDKTQQVSGLDDAAQNNTNQSGLIDFDGVYTDADGKILDIKTDANDPTDSVEKRIEKNAQSKKAKWDKYNEYLMSELSEGAAFAIFNVDYTGSIGESFSNSFGGNPLETMFNSISAKSRQIGDLLSSASSVPIIGDAMKLAGDAGAKILSEASFGVANPLLALAYGVNISMPKVWESSSATLPRASYKIKLISPYGNAYSQLFNIYMPLAMILAGSLPRATGKTSYTYPFFCQLFDRGRTNIQLGMIESVSLTRGTSNLAFSRSGHPNAIDVDLNIANLDEIISVDVNDSGVISKALDALSPDFSDTPFVSYLNTITAVDVYTQIYRVPMLRLKLAERYMTLKSVTNPDPAAFAAWTVNTIPGFGVAKTILGDNASALHTLTNQ